MQNRSVLMLACGTAALVVCAAAQATSLSRADRQFMNTVATMEMTGAHEGQLAQDKASSGEVKDFARMLAKDEGESYGHLSQLAAKTGVDIPRGINTARIPEVKGLEALKGAHFDRQFARDEVLSEERALAVFKREAKAGQNSDVKAYASSMIPVVNSDLQRAQKCAGAAK